MAPGQKLVAPALHLADAREDGHQARAGAMIHLGTSQGRVPWEKSPKVLGKISVPWEIHYSWAIKME